MQREPSHTNRKFKFGFSLVELLVAVSIFLLFVVTISDMSVNSGRQLKRSVNNERAAELASEAVEIIKNIRDADFATLAADTTLGIASSSNVWILTGTPDTNGIFTRSIDVVATGDPDKWQVDVTINWDDEVATGNEYKVSTFVTNWQQYIPPAGLTIKKVIIDYFSNAGLANFAPYNASIIIGTTTTNTTLDTGTAVEAPTKTYTFDKIMLDPGTYTISESVSSNYTQTFGDDCIGTGVISLASNDNKVCTITNEEKYATLTVNKIVSGGTAVASDFEPYKVGTTTVILATATKFPAGTYTVSETTNPSYVQTFTGNCNSSGSVTLNIGDVKTCTITNTQNVSLPSVITNSPVTSITQTTASSGGNVTSDGNATVTARGVVWDTSSNPTIALSTKTSNGTGTGTFTSSITSLTCGTTYFVRAYATNSQGTNYGSNVSFTTSACSVVPTVTTPTFASVTGTTALLGANVTSLGIPALITARGTCWGTTIDPVTNCTAEGGTTTGVFTHTRTGLVPGTTYYFRGYATNATGTAYSVSSSFTTPGGACTITGITPSVSDSSGTALMAVNTPTGIQANDLMFAHVMHNNAADVLTTVPAGWTQVGRHRNGTSNQALFYKLATASEPASYSFGLSASSRMAVTINGYRGCFNLATPLDVSSNTEYVVNNTTYRAASMTLPSAYTTVIIFPSVNTTGAKTFAAPLTQSGGWAEDYANGNASSRFSRNAYRKLITTAGATGVIDSIGFSASTVKHAFAVGLKPL